MTRFGCAYWGRDKGMARLDFMEMVSIGISWVVIPISSERMRFDRYGAAKVVSEAERVGLETRIAPWGVGGLFGGEGVRDGEFAPRKALRWWLDQADQYIAPDAMYWDEPHGEAGVMAMQWARSFNADTIPGEKQYLYINPDRSHGWPGVATGIAGIGVDAYESVGVALLRHLTASERYGLPVHVWVKSFGLSIHDVLKPANEIRALVEAGVEDIGIWGYPSSGCSVLDNAAPMDTWSAIVREIVRIKQS